MKTKHFLSEILAILGVLGVILAAGCGHNKRADALDNIKLECKVTPEPPHVGQAVVTVELSKPDGKPLTGAKVQVEGNMNHAGMKPVFANAREVHPGEYEARLEFTMRGDWFVLLNVTLPDGHTATRKVNVPGVKGG